jgi:hypothetical protein
LGLELLGGISSIFVGILALDAMMKQPLHLASRYSVFPGMMQKGMHVSGQSEARANVEAILLDTLWQREQVVQTRTHLPARE